MVPLFMNFHPEATLNGFHFTSPPSSLPVFYLQNGNKLYVASSVWIIYVPKLICLSFRSNFSYQIQMQILLNKSFERKKMCHEMFSEWFHTSPPPVHPSVNIELTSLSEAGCEAIRFKRNNLAAPSRLWHNLNAAMTSAPPIFKLRSVFLRGSHPRCWWGEQGSLSRPT